MSEGLTVEQAEYPIQSMRGRLKKKFMLYGVEATKKALNMNMTKKKYVNIFIEKFMEIDLYQNYVKK